MRVRHLLVPLVVSAVGVVAVQAAASAHDGHNNRHHGNRHDSAPLIKQDFTLTNDVNGNGGPVVASGAINASGQDVVVSDTQDTFTFPDGSLTVFHAPVRSKDHFNEQKCTDTLRETGRYVIASGTGQYEGYSGSGEYLATGRIENACENQTPTGTINVTARGSINIPSS